MNVKRQAQIFNSKDETECTVSDFLVCASSLQHHLMPNDFKPPSEVLGYSKSAKNREISVLGTPGADVPGQYSTVQPRIKLYMIELQTLEKR